MADTKINAKDNPPAKDPAMGEKTPAYAEWLKKHFPDEYATKFTNWKGK